MGAHLSAACLLCGELAAAEAQGSEGWLQDSWTQSDVLVGGFMIEDGRGGTCWAAAPPAAVCSSVCVNGWDLSMPIPAYAHSGTGTLR